MARTASAILAASAPGRWQIGCTTAMRKVMAVAPARRLAPSSQNLPGRLKRRRRAVKQAVQAATGDERPACRRSRDCRGHGVERADQRQLGRRSQEHRGERDDYGDLEQTIIKHGLAPTGVSDGALEDRWPYGTRDVAAA